MYTSVMKHDILIIDDEQSVLSLFTKFLTGLNYAVTTAPSLAAARERLARTDFQAVIIDQYLPDGKGVELINDVRSANPTAAIVMITGQADIPLAVEAMQKGADNFLTKPVQLKELAVFLEKSLEVVSLRRLAQTSDLLKKKGPFFFGTSAAMGKALEIAQVAVENDGPVLITGETGVGKGVLARWIHESSNRRKGAFVEVSCPSFRGELLRSELYGHAKGSFTSAVQDQPGLLEAADGGTLFLDEIGDMDLSMQAKLLRVLEEKNFRRVGGVKDIKVDVRVISATNQDLSSARSDSKFRKDLYYRLQVVPIILPPLRERGQDVLLLARHFTEYFSRECHKSIKGISKEVERVLLSYSWPGNVRELKNVIERAMIFDVEQEILSEHIPQEIMDSGTVPVLHPESAISLDCIVIPESGISIEDVEHALVKKALQMAGDNQTRAAQLLKMPRDAFRRRMKRFGLI